MDLKQLEICRLNIQLTKKCNQRCKMCNSYNLECTNELSKKEIFDIIRNTCENYNIKNIAFTGGEPTLRKDIYEIIKFSKKYCENISITTNGSYLVDKKNVEKLLSCGLNRFTLSYHGIGTHSDYVGVSGSEEKIREAIKNLSTVPKSIFIKIGILLTNETVEKMDEMINYCKDVGALLYIELPDDSIPIFENNIRKNYDLSQKQQIEFLNNISRWIENKEPIMVSKNIKKYIEMYFNRIKITGPCPLGYTDIYISSDGDVYSGCWAMESIGNTRVDNIKKIVSSERYLKNVKKMISRDCIGCTCGYLFQSNFILND